MRRIASIAGLNLKQIARDRSELLSLVLLPLLLTWVFGAAFGSSSVVSAIVVPVADLDGSVYSQRFVTAIGESSAVDVKPVSEATALQLVADGENPVAVVVAKGFGERIEDDEVARVRVVRDPGSASAQAAAQVVDSAAMRTAADAQAARVAARALAGSTELSDLFEYADGLWSPDPPVAVESRVVLATQARENELEAPANTQYSLGFTVFFITMVALSSAGGVIEEREYGTLRRLLAAPVRRAEVLVGKTLGVALVASAEGALLVGAGVLVFGVPWGHDPVPVALVLGSLVIAATGLGIMISALVRTRSQMIAIVPVLSTAMAMVGGCYWPLDITSPFMQKLALVTPTGWAMTGLTNVVARGGGLAAAALPAAILLVFGAVCLAIGIPRLRLE